MIMVGTSIVSKAFMQAYAQAKQGEFDRWGENPRPFQILAGDCYGVGGCSTPT